MGLVSFTQEIESPNIAPGRMFKAMMIDSHNLFPKLIPHVIKSMYIIQGDGGEGSIKQINFTEGSLYMTYVKYRVDKMDEEKCECTNSIIEAGGLEDKLESIIHKVKYLDDGRGGCIRKVWSEYYTVQDFKLTEEDLEMGKEKVQGLCKIVEEYLLANPDIYV